MLTSKRLLGAMALVLLFLSAVGNAAPAAKLSCPNYPNRIAVQEKDFETFCAGKIDGVDVAVAPDGAREEEECEPRTCNKPNSKTAPPPYSNSGR